MLDAEIPAGLFKAVGGEAAAAVGQHVRDMHDTGIYTWTYLRELGERGAELFSAYEDELREKGMGQYFLQAYDSARKNVSLARQCILIV